MECELQICEVAQKLVSTPLIIFQDLKLSTKDRIALLKDALNITLGLLPITDSHATWVPSNILERHLIGSRVADDVRNFIATLALGSRLRQGVARLWAKRETRESHHMLLRVQRM